MSRGYNTVCVHTRARSLSFSAAIQSTSMPDLLVRSHTHPAAQLCDRIQDDSLGIAIVLMVIQGYHEVHVRLRKVAYDVSNNVSHQRTYNATPRSTRD